MTGRIRSERSRAPAAMNGGGTPVSNPDCCPGTGLRDRIPVLIIILFLSACIAPASASHVADHVIIVGADEYFPPYEYVDHSGRPGGFNIDIMNAVAEEMSLNISIRPGPWQDVRSDLESGNIDLVSGMFYSEGRDAVVNFSRPYITVSHAVFVGDGSDISNSDDLKGKEIAVEEGDIMHDYALGLDPSNTIIPVKNQYDALMLVSSGACDAALISKLHGEYLINSFGITGVHPTGHPLEIRDYCIAASANGSVLLPTIDEGLAIIKKNGRYDQIYNKWFGVYEEREFFATLMKIVVFVLLPAIILLAGALLWSVSLRKRLTKTSAKLEDELAEQKKVKARLQESKDKYQALFNSLNEAVFLCDYDAKESAGTIVEVNDAASRSLGYTHDELMGRNTGDICRMSPPDREMIMEKLANGIGQVSFYTEHMRKDGSVFPVQVKMRFLNHEGKVYILQVARDITKERESRRIETDALKKIEENLTQLATLNDEIRNPLMVITGVTDMDFENSREIIYDQVTIIDGIITRLDQGWIESSKIREFLRKHLDFYGDEEGDSDNDSDKDSDNGSDVDSGTVSGIVSDKV
ncbi:transporter substrate-binding domain-containing protein [Methanogenium sp. S4BF]|uniref:transporter substrate-binding domain-containing protein n=1 Tax=Methanogenium sp. S4BF TaxID=1789226 RepID=UPI002417245C|nr:transporter substrate-binding domain-containing protein [Methanogenium sp. S4BF]WFN33483.1 transporter substrate-binding domain-containing protein [Methanogenium sp. S4BF]